MNVETGHRPAMSWEQAVTYLRGLPDQQDLVRACYYDDPLPVAAERFRCSGEWAATRAYLPPTDGRVLELGAGRGIASYALAYDGWRVTALEPDPSVLVGAGAIRQLAIDTGVKMDVVQEWGERLPFAEGSFDVVYCRAVLHHAADLPQLCREVARVLREGGTFVAAREHVISSPDDLPAFLAQHPLHRYYGGENAYLLRQYRHAIEQAGITLSAVLNPWASEINLFPTSLREVKEAMGTRMHWPWPGLLPDWLVGIMGGWLKSPGRLYTFVGNKNA